MFKSSLRLVAAIIASSTLLSSGQSRACWFCDCFKSTPPTYAAAACAPPTYNVCPQQVSYVPQTNYATQYACTPCTSYQPVSSCDPCGGSQTVMQPVTTYVRRPIMVPYTTYRPVVTQLNYAAPACSTCGSTPYYTPTAGCSTCGGGAATVGYAPAAAGYGAVQANYAAVPMYSTTTAGPALAGSVMAMPGQSGPALGATGMSPPVMNSPPLNYNYQPTPAAPSGASVPSTFQQNSSAAPSSSQMVPVNPIQDPEKTNSSMTAPRFPEAQNRTTSTGPMIGPALVTPAIFNTAQRSQVFHLTSLASEQAPASAPATAAPAVCDGWQSSGSR